MKLKLDENGNVVVQDGKPVYVHDDGKEVPFDAAGTVATIGRLNAEAKGHRERAEKAEKALEAYEGIPDPEAARKALETVTNLDRKKLVDAGEVERVKEEIAKGYETKLTEAQKKAQEFESQLYQEKIGGSFARSKFIDEKLAIPVDFVQAQFGRAFKIEEGRTVAYDANGNKIYSRSKPGELAEFDEALEQLIDAYPMKDRILKGSGGSGTGASSSGKANGGGSRTISRKEFEALGAVQRAEYATAMREGKATISE